MRKILFILILLSIGFVNAQPIKAVVGMKHGGGGGGVPIVWDISTASILDSADFSSQVTGSIVAIAMSPDGTKLYVVDGSGGPTTYQYTLSTPYDITTRSCDSKSFNNGGSVAQISFSDDGTKYYVWRSSSYIRGGTMSSAWDISTLGSLDSYNDSGQMKGDQGGGTKLSNLTKFYITDETNLKAYAYTASIAGDITTLSYATDSISFSSQSAGLSNAIILNSDGSSLYINSDNDNTIFQYSLSTAGQLKSGSYSGKSFGYLATVHSASSAFILISNRLYIASKSGTNRKIFMYSVSY